MLVNSFARGQGIENGLDGDCAISSGGWTFILYSRQADGFDERYKNGLDCSFLESCIFRILWNVLYCLTLICFWEMMLVEH